MGDKYAVCVGNNYPGTTAELSGCVNDAHDWRDLLETQGYDVTVLLEAPARLMVDTLMDAVGSAGWGDRVVFTFSGHGTWRPDTDGDEADGRDEALVAADMTLVGDDELQRVFDRLHTAAGGLILSDSCHSGTVSRFASTGNNPPWSPVAAARPRFMPPTAFYAGLSEVRALELETREASLPRRTANLVSGAKDAEYAWDAWFGERANGAFTRAAIDAYRPGVSLAGWHRAIGGVLPSETYPQTPQLTSSSLYRRYAAAL